MTPDQLSKSGTEHAHQVALMAWAAVATCHGFRIANSWATLGNDILKMGMPSNPIPCLKWLHAIHNQGHGDAIRGGRTRAEGVKAGIADIFLPRSKFIRGLERSITYHGLYIEMKKPSMRPVKEGSKGGLSQEQTEFKNYAIENGYRWEVAYGWKEAAKIIQDYLS